MRKAFYRDNRMVPLGIMLLTAFVFLYHFELDRQSPPSKIPDPNSPEPLAVNHQDTAKQEHPHAERPAVPSSAPPASSSTAHQPKKPGLTTEDVVLMFKTGASVLWKRVPIHLATSLLPSRISPENIILYSDYPDRIGSWEFIDVLANASDKIRQSEDFLPYLQQEDYEARQNYAEISNMPGDAAGPSGGWKLDKYKFLPIVQHAGRNKPWAKWYIFMEDDSYLILPNLLRHLDNFDHQKPWYLGSLAWTHGDYFAHGGSGFALSRGAWEKSFGREPNMAEKFAEFAEAHGCGDHILGHVLREYGVDFGETHDDNRFRYGFNPEAHWSTWFEKENWCKPVYSWHHTHGKDVARLFNLEMSWDFNQGPIRYRNIFNELVRPFLRPRVEWWDNWSSKQEIRSNNGQDAQPPETFKAQSQEVWRKAWHSVDDCEAACEAWADCVQWSFYEDRCKMDTMVLLGSGFPEGDPRRQTSLPWVSGWMKERIDRWNCQE